MVGVKSKAKSIDCRLLSRPCPNPDPPSQWSRRAEVVGQGKTLAWLEQGALNTPWRHTVGKGVIKGEGTLRNGGEQIIVYIEPDCLNSVRNWERLRCLFTWIVIFRLILIKTWNRFMLELVSNSYSEQKKSAPV